MEMDERELNFINSPLRRFFLKYYELRIFKQFLKKNGISLIDKVILDAGCGSGYSSELILEEFQPGELVAFDIMPKQIELARNRGLNVNFFIGDATNTELPSEKFDAVFIFDILHHVPGWRKALKEVSRIIKPGGAFLIEEPGNRALYGAERYFKIYHPEEAMFDWPEFFEGLEETGFNIIESRKMFMNHFQSFMCIKS